MVSDLGLAKQEAERLKPSDSRGFLANPTSPSHSEKVQKNTEIGATPRGAVVVTTRIVLARMPRESADHRL
jgi:hypothetical protein